MNAPRKGLASPQIGAKPGSQLKVEDAQIIAALVQERGGSCTAEEFVEASRPRASPTHHLFEWDDRVAATEYRLEQARQYLRSVTVEVVTTSGSINMRLFEAVDGEEEAKTYKLVSHIARNSEEMDQVLEDAKRQLDAFRRKFSMLRTLPTFAPVLRAIDSMFSKL